MHLSPWSSAVVVLSTPHGVDPTLAGQEVFELDGVASVTAYPERGQLLVRYDSAAISAEELRAAIWPEAEVQLACGPWLIAWPRLASALPIAANLL